MKFHIYYIIAKAKFWGHNDMLHGNIFFERYFRETHGTTTTIIEIYVVKIYTLPTKGEC